MVKRCIPKDDVDPAMLLGQLTWSLHGGPVNAWLKAKSRAGFAGSE